MPYLELCCKLSLLTKDPYGLKLENVCKQYHGYGYEECPYQGSGKPENSRSGPKLRILDRFQTPQNANKSVQQVCALNPIFPQPTNFHESMMSKKSQMVKSSQTDNVRAPFKCDIMVVKRL